MTGYDLAMGVAIAMFRVLLPIALGLIGIGVLIGWLVF